MKIVGIFGWLLAALLCGCDRPVTEVSPVQYRLSGTARRAVVEYRLPDGSTNRQTVAIPFQSDIYPYPLRTTAFVRASNTTASGEMWLEIYIDGHLDRGLGFKPMAQHTTNAYGVVSATCYVGAR